MKLLRQLVLSCMQLNKWFKAKHISVKLNVIADKLSRFEFQKAKHIAPWLDVSTTTVPDYLHPKFWL